MPLNQVEPVGGTLRVRLLLRSGGSDQPVGSLDAVPTAASDKIGYITTNATADGDIVGAAVTSRCGDLLVLRLEVLPGTSDLMPFPMLDIP